MGQDRSTTTQVAQSPQGLDSYIYVYPGDTTLHRAYANNVCPVCGEKAPACKRDYYVTYENCKANKGGKTATCDIKKHYTQSYGWSVTTDGSSQSPVRFHSDDDLTDGRLVRCKRCNAAFYQDYEDGKMVDGGGGLTYTGASSGSRWTLPTAVGSIVTK